MTFVLLLFQNVLAAFRDLFHVSTLWLPVPCQGSLCHLEGHDQRHNVCEQNLCRFLSSNVSLHHFNKMRTVYKQADAALFSAVCFSSGLLLTMLTYTLNPMIWTILQLEQLHAPVEQEDKHCQIESNSEQTTASEAWLPSTCSTSCSKQCFYSPAYCFLLLHIYVQYISFNIQYIQ